MSVRSVMANVPNCNLAVSEFELQSGYSVQFRTNTSEKRVNSLIPQAMS